MSPFLVAPFFVSAVLLTAAGWNKLFRPAPTRDLLQALSLPLSRCLAAALAALEISVGSLALLYPSPRSSASLAVLYSALTLFLIYLRFSHPNRSCACLGSSHSPSSTTHIVLNATAVVIAIALTATGGPDLYALAKEQAYALPVYAAGLVAASWLVYLTVRWLPGTPKRVSGARSPSISRSLTIG